MTLRAWVVVDLGFGDAGKGSVTDFLVRDQGAGLVVRFGGGAQAGHNVVSADGRHHTFSQVGAGTFVAGVGTHLGPAFRLHPGALRVELARLRSAGVEDALERLTVDRRATLITPFHQAAGRLRELLRGPEAHGTCGVGVGEAVADRLQGHDDHLCASDLKDRDRLRRRLLRQQARKRDELAPARGLQDARAHPELALLQDRAAVERTLELWEPLGAELQVVDQVEASQRLQHAGTVILEGAQGILLDEVWGFHPHTTWADCTPAGAQKVLAGLAAETTCLGVLRAYTIRHGPGPMPTHDPGHDRTHPELHNDAAGWQGLVRTGPLDLVLMRYALQVCPGIDALALTHLDRVGDPVPVCSGYRELRDQRGLLEELPPGAPGDLQHRQELGRRLALVTCRLEAVPRRELARAVESALRRPVLLESHGPTAHEKRWKRQGTC